MDLKLFVWRDDKYATVVFVLAENEQQAKELSYSRDDYLTSYAIDNGELTVYDKPCIFSESLYE